MLMLLNFRGWCVGFLTKIERQCLREEYYSPGIYFSIRLLHKLNREKIMLLTIVIVLGILWLLGLVADIGGNFIHLVLLIALVVLVYDFVVGRRQAE